MKVRKQNGPANAGQEAIVEAVDGAERGPSLEDEEQEEEEAERSAMQLSYEDMLALGELAGKVDKGLSAEALSRLPVVRVCALRGDSGVVSLNRCCICQLEFEEAEDATPLSCRHCYHSDCVRQWLQQSKACPICGKEVEAV
ncbi:hypothetical protein VOLCADRAFT_86603 [Volvox carteri f. nagariensis]|uniref:RING-type domain-containing protein n=1 Tax=Volvox carteri f. nagariensis TaxID=3068 RepID=D8TJ40_VOLCA|nr:uncharacterized protein VOLCADRAFT_86603 [Volvox carteri f. nagariensis]EFJ52471.1 hypothetical protein VOLCADRAFT_86603 [Volvox carteri f. nagariensis]|eukprot:XP_002946544.1 hypothetical protein VOLCADRAFT_86603 [Volvox carteri f. nagariensis]